MNETREIKCELAVWQQLAERNYKAEEYSREARKRRMSKANRLVNFFRKNAESIAITVLILATIGMLGYGFTREKEHRYAIAGEDNGIHYIYVTERKCVVTEVTDNKVIVSYKGELYSFYGNGYEVGQKITCKFTDDMEIVGVVE